MLPGVYVVVDVVPTARKGDRRLVRFASRACRSQTGVPLTSTRRTTAWRTAPA